MSIPELKFYDRDGDLVILAEEVSNFHTNDPYDKDVVLCLASDRDYIESDGYFKYFNRKNIRLVAKEELPLYLGMKYKSAKFMEIFK